MTACTRRRAAVTVRINGTLDVFLKVKPTGLADGLSSGYERKSDNSVISGAGKCINGG